METITPYQNFPARIVILSNLVSFLIYLSGFLIILKLSWITAIFYIFYVLALEYRLLKKHCTSCDYWGRVCGFGKGRLSSVIFRKGDPSKFCQNSFGWKDMIPDMLVTLLPVLTGIVLLIIKFDLVLLFLIIVLIAMSTIGNSIVRGSFACKYCSQRLIGCPAEQLFSKNNEKA